MPLIVEKTDGGYTYDTTDLAAIRYRIRDARGRPAALRRRRAAAPALRAGLRRRAHGRLADDDGRRAPRRVRLGARRGRQDAAHAGRAAGHAGGAAPRGGRARAAPCWPSAACPRAPIRRRWRARSASARSSTPTCRRDRERDYVFSFDRMLSLDGNTSRLPAVRQRAGALGAGARRRTPPAGALHARPSRPSASWPSKLLEFPATVQDVLSRHAAAQALHVPVRHGGGVPEFYDAARSCAPTSRCCAPRAWPVRADLAVIAEGLDLLGIEARLSRHGDRRPGCRIAAWIAAEPVDATARLASCAAP